jgi:hypothetical protein
MKRIPLGNGKSAMVDDNDFAHLSKWRWCDNGNGYARRNAGKQGKQFMHRVILGASDGSHVDHVNGDSLDNRRLNLRYATQRQNVQNGKIRKTNLLGIKGVSRNRLKFRARIVINGSERHLGSFDTIQEAKDVYDKAAKEHFGEYARSH